MQYLKATILPQDIGLQTVKIRQLSRDGWSLAGIISYLLATLRLVYVSFADCLILCQVTLCESVKWVGTSLTMVRFGKFNCKCWWIECYSWRGLSVVDRYMYARGGHSTLLSVIYNYNTTHCLQYRRHMRSRTAGHFLLFYQYTDMLHVPPSYVTLNDTKRLRAISGNQLDVWLVKALLHTVCIVLDQDVWGQCPQQIDVPKTPS